MNFSYAKRFTICYLISLAVFVVRVPPCSKIIEEEPNLDIKMKFRVLCTDSARLRFPPRTWRSVYLLTNKMSGFLRGIATV